MKREGSPDRGAGGPAPSAGHHGSSCTKRMYQHIGRYKVTRL